jgi:hypothetical protein
MSGPEPTKPVWNFCTLGHNWNNIETKLGNYELTHTYLYIGTLCMYLGGIARYVSRNFMKQIQWYTGYVYWRGILLVVPHTSRKVSVWEQ